MAKTQSTKTPLDATSILEGVNENSRRSELFDRLRQAAALLGRQQDERVGRLQEIEERVIANYGANTYDIRQVMVSASPEEYDAAIDFLNNFEDLLPIALARFNEGAKMVMQDESQQQGESKQGTSS